MMGGYSDGAVDTAIDWDVEAGASDMGDDMMSYSYSARLVPQGMEAWKCE